MANRRGECASGTTRTPVTATGPGNRPTGQPAHQTKPSDFRQPKRRPYPQTRSVRATHTTEDGRAMTTPGTNTAAITNDIVSGGAAGGLLLVSR